MNNNKNKKKSKMRRGECHKREVLMIAPDGSIAARYASVSATAKHLKRTLTSVIRSCRGRGLCCNRRLMYAEEYVKWGDYRYKPHRNRDERGRLVKGHHTIGRLSAEGRERMRIAARKRVWRQIHDPNSRFGKGCVMAVVCVNTGERFDSQKAAALHYGLEQSTVSRSVHFGLRCKGGLKFAKADNG